MTIKHITCPVAIKYRVEETYFKDEFAKKQDKLADLIDQAEAELDQCLNDGYELVTSHILEDSKSTNIVYLLHKRELKTILQDEPPQPDVTSLAEFQELVRGGEYVVLDTETTGLKRGEICQIAIIDQNANILLDTLVKTTEPIPPAATDIHGISNDDVKDAPTWSDVAPRVRELLKGRDVVIYNATYDRKMMHQSNEAAGLAAVDYKTEANYWDAMTLYAEFWGEWNDYHGNYRWQKLVNACKQQDIPVAEAHTALGDCRLTLALIKQMV